jgi:hypothetical protein
MARRDNRHFLHRGPSGRCPVQPSTPLGPDQVNVLLLLWAFPRRHFAAPAHEHVPRISSLGSLVNRVHSAPRRQTWTTGETHTEVKDLTGVRTLKDARLTNSDQQYRSNFQLHSSGRRPPHIPACFKSRGLWRKNAPIRRCAP